MTFGPDKAPSGLQLEPSQVHSNTVVVLAMGDGCPSAVMPVGHVTTQPPVPFCGMTKTILWPVVHEVGVVGAVFAVRAAKENVVVVPAVALGHVSAGVALNATETLLAAFPVPAPVAVRVPPTNDSPLPTMTLENPPEPFP